MMFDGVDGHPLGIKSTVHHQLVSDNPIQSPPLNLYVSLNFHFVS